MIKKLTAKTQELNPKLPQYSNSFAKSLIIKPDTPELLLKKGTIYTLFEISGSSNFDTELVSKVINDVIHDSYYQSESISPIQSMEKAVAETREKILQLSSDTLTSDPQGVNVNFLIAILWGNVLYIIQFGEARGYLVKGGEINPLEMISEGNFSSSSKIVDEDEVLILCTKPFESAFPPEKLLSASIPENDLDSNQACLLMRLLIDTSFSPDEEIDFGLKDVESKSRTRESVNNIKEKIGIVVSKVTSVIKKAASLFGPLTDVAMNIFKRAIPKRKTVLLTRKITQLSVGKNEKTRGWLFLSIVGVLLALSVFFVLRSVLFKGSKDQGEVVVETEEILEQQDLEEEFVEDRSKDEEYKVKRVSPEVFYDLKIIDSQVNPTEVEVVGDKLFIVDRSSGKMYHSDVATPNFVTENNSFPSAKSLSQSGSLLTFNDEEGYKTYDTDASQVKDSYKVEGLNLTFPYAGFIYSISNDILTRSTEKDGGLEGVVWGQNLDFRNAKSMAIAYSIYILKESGELVNYVGGSKTNFSVSGLEKPFLDPVKVIANIDFKNIYVADRGNRSIVAIDDKGNLIKQYKNENGVDWNDIRSISVSLDEKSLFVLNSSKIYKINIED